MGDHLTVVVTVKSNNVAATRYVRVTFTRSAGDTARQQDLSDSLRQRLTELRNIFMRWGPVRFACIAVELQHTGFQRLFEPFVVEGDSLVMAIRTNDFKIDVLSHVPR